MATLAEPRAGIPSRCPGCRALYRLKPEQIGKSVRCRNCSGVWTAVAEAPAKPKAAAPVAATAPSKSRRPLLIGSIALAIVAVGATLAWALKSPAPAAAVVQDKPKPKAAAPETKPQEKPKPATTTAPPPPPAAKKAPAVDPNILATDEFFKSPKVVELSIDIAPADYEQLKREPRKYVRATLKEGAKTYPNVAVHLKGAAGSFRQIDDKAGFTVNMDKFVDDQHFHGLDKFHLNNSVQDPSFVSELMCSDFFAQNGVPAARCSHAILTVNGRMKGFYVLKEGYDVQFIERNFGSKKGNLYDGGFLRELDQPLQVISEKDDLPPYTELKSLWSAAQLPDPAKRFAEMDRLLDSERWVTYLVLEVLMFDWDGYPMNRNNYRVYHDPKRDKIVFIPSGTDQMFGDPNGTLLPNFNGYVAKAYVTTPEGRLKYFTRMDEILKTTWKVEGWNKRLDELEAVLKPALAKVDAGHANGLKGHMDRLRNHFAQRLVSAPPQVKRLINPTPPKTIAGGPGLPDDGFFRKYLFLGPVPTQGLPGNQSIHKDWIGGETALKPTAGAKAKTHAGEMAWKLFETHDGMVDFHAASGKQADGSAGYLFAYLVTDKEFKDLHLKMGSDDQGKVWINGKEVLKFEGDRGAAPDQDTATGITLNKGVNTVLFKVVNGGGGFQGVLRLMMPDGNPFMDARLSVDGK